MVNKRKNDFLHLPFKQLIAPVLQKLTVIGYVPNYIKFLPCHSEKVNEYL